MYELSLTAVTMFVVKWSRAASMSWGVLIGWLVDGERESIIAKYLVQLTHLGVCGGEEVIGESESVSSTGLWSDESSLRFVTS